MNKILLVYEDYADLMSVEATLKKVGFDVIGLSSEYAIAEQVLAFNPDLVVGSGRGGKVNSLGVGKRLKEMTRWPGKAILIFPANFKPNPQELIRIRVDMILEAPVPPLRLVQVIGKLLGHDEAVLLERLNKASHFDSPAKTGATGGGGSSKYSPEDEAIYVKGTVGDSEESGALTERSLGVEKVDVDSQDISSTDDTQEEKRLFRFGDRMSEAEREVRGQGSEEEAFPDVDLRALERELTGGGVPEVESIETQDLIEAPPEVPPSLENPGAEEVAQSSGMNSPDLAMDALEEAEIQARAFSDLQKAEQGLAERVAKYRGMVADVKVSPKSTVTRVEARRRQRQLAAEWDEQNLNKLDELRREFTKALFKK